MKRPTIKGGSDMHENMKRMIGQCFMGGFPGKEMSEAFVELVKKYKVGNVILFRHNVEDSTQLKALCQSIQTLVMEETGHPALISIDQEGGVVTRLPESCCNVPGAMAIAATGNPANAKAAAKITAEELKYLGINFNLAPVMDVNNNINNPVIGVRSYGDNPQTVIDYACQAIQGYKEVGIISCAKHFPGHGDTAVDSHLGLPSIDKSVEELKALELLPFMAAIEQHIPAIMSSHILFPQIEAEQIPCTMSYKIITELLKEDLGFSGLVVSDCLEMDAIQKYYGTATGALSALNAGIDLLCISHTSASVEAAIKSVYEALESGEMSETRMTDAATKVIEYKAQYCKDCMNHVAEWDEEGNKARERQIRKETLALVQGQLFELGDHPFFVSPPDYRATQVSSKESTVTTFAEYMAQELGGMAHVTSKNPDAKEIQEVAEKAATATSIVMATYNGHLMKGQVELVHKLASGVEKIGVVALRNPYDLSNLPEHVTAIAAWDYTEMTLELLAEVWKNQESLTGKMPVAI